jgi:ribosomal-protein-alanine N-acetyltransferase
VLRRTILSTSRLVVTTWLPEDVEDLHRLHSDSLTMRYVRHGRPETRDETEDLLARYIDEQATRGWTKWRVVDHRGDLVGRAGFGPRGPANRELGYTIRRDLWGRGLATEIAAALVGWHRDHDGGANAGTQLWAYAAIENVPSRRVLEKIGFTLAASTDHNGIPCALYRLAG